MVKYVWGLINKKKGKRVDEGALKCRKEYCEVDIDELNLPELEDRYKEAKIDWENFKKEEKDKQQKHLLDLYPSKIIGDSSSAKKKRKQAMKSVKYAQYRQYTFNRLSRGVGKGEKKLLKQVRRVNEEGIIEEEYHNRESIEQAIAQQNIIHFW